MFIYLSKKIAIPNQTKINAVAWNKADGFIAAGGEDGLLKVLKLDSGADQESGNKNSRGLAAASNLSLNQTLEGHNEAIRVLVWNETHRRLTTSDQSGVIIVWMMYKGSWYEEMINNRKKSTVVGMAWTADGLKICIIYEDGAVIVGSVDGNRIWGKELKGPPLTGVQWSPDSKLLLFSLRNGQVHLYDNQGNFAMKIDIHCLEIPDEEVPVVCLDWYNGKNGCMHALCPNLAIAYENGHIQLMCNENDLSPIIFDTRMIVVHCSWNHNGSLLAITGYQITEDKQCNLVQFYNPFGEHLRTLRVPGTSITSCVWEGTSLRVALAVDSFVYFANIRPDYKWCYFKKTVVYTYCRPQKPGISVCFWDTSTDQCHVQHIPVLLAIAAYGDHCVLSVISDSPEDTGGTFGLILCNTVGTPVDAKYIDIQASFVTMNSSFVIAASKDNFLIWPFRTPKTSGIDGGRMKSKLFHIDDAPSGAIEILKELDDSEKFIQMSTHSTLDPISCMACSDKCLVIGRESGVIHYYALPFVVLSNRYKIPARPHKMAINSNSSRLSVIDVAGVMTIIEIAESLGRPPSEINKFERKDVWAMCWASDNPQLLAIMEKTRMYIIKGLFPEEPISCSGYICSFNDLEVQAVLLDEIMEVPDKPSKDCFVNLEVKSLRDTRVLLEKVGITEADLFIEDNPHPRLWRLLAEAALKQLNFDIAESAFVRSRDFAKVSFVKKLKEIHNESIVKAKTATYFKNFDEAEKIFLQTDRSDLALNLRQTIGDWFRVIQMLKTGTIASDKVLKAAYNATADYFMDSNNWSAAVEYYELAKNTPKMIECYYHLENYDHLVTFIDSLPEKDPLLERIGNIFATDGVHTEAARAFVKFGNVKAAIDVCVQLNRWDTAIELAKTYNIDKISEYFNKYTAHLIEQNKLKEAIDVNVQAKYYLQAAEHAFKYANQIQLSSNISLTVKKKYFVYAAKLLQLHNRSPNSAETKSFGSELFFNAWRGAEAYHYLMLTQDNLYSGKLHDALCAAYKLQDYDDIIPVSEVYSFYALTACLNRAFGLCSRSLIKLKTIEGLSDNELAQYEKLSWEIFTKNEPLDSQFVKTKCSNCQQAIADWLSTCPHCYSKFETCVASGQPIIDEKVPTWCCSECNRKAFKKFMHFQKACPLCHSPFDNSF